ncbi:mannose phosphate isomerase [Dermatophagoides farinae]|uniref:mannose phosphate isomerase n=1 Tax=Dermatophagoides farinae TaxID=6954 RepID=UPI001F0E6F69|nr:mannose-6-phosphate isomerase-like [Dermatophagoides farinae]
MIPLRCCVKKYEWGKRGMDSCIARFLRNQMPSYTVDDDTPFAELWMGTHPSGPSVVVGSTPDQNNITLLNFLSNYPEYAGNVRVVTKFGKNLPFLFKVLSVRKALSIQAHPDKALAEKLHHDDPFHYPDANHKPELAIALTEFEALCGFRPHEEIEFFLNNVPEFKNVVGTDAAKTFSETADKKQGLKDMFTSMMNSSENVIRENLTSLQARWYWSNQSESNQQLETIRKVFVKLNKEFPNDIGCFSIFWFNYLVLQPGDAIFIGEDEPHAYFRGDCIECMACSDNVVRAGLTPKFKDVKTLCNMLTYNSRAPKEQHCQPMVVDKFTKSYIVPVPEYVVDAIEIGQEHISATFQYQLDAKESGSVVVVIRGEAKVQDQKIFTGYVGFIPAQTKLIISDVKSPLLIYRAYCRLDE